MSLRPGTLMTCTACHGLRYRVEFVIFLWLPLGFSVACASCKGTGIMSRPTILCEAVDPKSGGGECTSVNDQQRAA
jgi:hypothetical protein